MRILYTLFSYYYMNSVIIYDLVIYHLIYSMSTQNEPRAEPKITFILELVYTLHKQEAREERKTELKPSY